MDSTFRISSGAMSDRGLSEKRPQNEDSYLEMNQSGIFAVADGVGGAQAGEVASQMAVEILAEAFSNFPTGSDPEGVMRTAIGRANAAIYQMAQDLAQLASMATTIVALHVDGNIATIGHVGDSRLYRVDHTGTLYRETDDHSMVADEVRAGRMTEAQAETHPSRNIISRALGAEPTVDVDLKTIMVEPGTSFLICSDGITRHISDPEIKGVLAFGGEPDEICQYLKDLCYERGAEDNLTAVVVKIGPVNEVVEGPPSSFDVSMTAAEPVPETAFDDEESTVATARSPFQSKVGDVEDEEELLELRTADPNIPEPEVHTSEGALFGAETLPFIEQEMIEDPDAHILMPAEPEPAPRPPALVAPNRNESGPMFGGSVEASPEPQSSGSLVRSLAMVLLGMVLGVGAYYLAFAPKPVDTSGPQLSEMRSSNIPLSAFEENRRNVDKDPAGYIARFAANPQDSEDYYLTGRAYLLLGDYPKARAAFIESRNRLIEADPINARVLASDIATAMAVTSDTTIQSILAKELSATQKPAANVNSNANR